MPSMSDSEMPTAGLPVPGDSEPIQITGYIEIGSYKFHGVVYWSPRAEVQTLDEIREERGA